ncbi:MAG TPA: hypothetical protein VGD50_07340, partial [Candidatus Baltobacteraceae bacterium]
MRRRPFMLGAFFACLPAVAAATGKDTAIVLATNDPDQDDACTDYLAEALRSRGVLIVDPSSVTLTYHQRSEIVHAAFGPIDAIS